MSLWQRGAKAFTLIELLVVGAIIVLVSSVVLADNNRFGGVVQLENLAYEIALSIRQAQVYGISVARFQTDTFTAGYGMHFDTSNPDSFIFFADALGTPNGIYDCPQPGTNNCELVQSTAISSGYVISKLCAPEGTDDASCNSVQEIDVVFQRPEPDAWISAGNIGTLSSCVQNAGACAASARIVLTSPRGDMASVIVESNGQISVTQ